MRCRQKLFAFIQKIANGLDDGHEDELTYAQFMK